MAKNPVHLCLLEEFIKIWKKRYQTLNNLSKALQLINGFFHHSQNIMKMRGTYLLLALALSTWSANAIPVSFDSSDSRVGNDLLSQSELTSTRLRKAEDSVPAAAGASTPKKEESSTSKTTTTSSKPDNAQDRGVSKEKVFSIIKKASYRPLK